MIPPEFSVAGRTVIVTAAGRGIGKGIARVLAEAGARVLVTALSERYMGPMAQELADRGHPIETLVADATSPDDWDRTVALALDRWGQIDVLVNNLGDAIQRHIVPLPGSKPAAAHSLEEWRRVLDVNLTQAFLGCRAVGPHFLERRRGRVINISGFAARKGNPGLAAYAAAKAGLVRLTQTLALEWAPFGVTVNSIAPGIFPDPETSDPRDLARSVARTSKRVPLGRVGQLREVGLLALFLASDASSYLTGEAIFLDGGLSQS